MTIGLRKCIACGDRFVVKRRNQTVCSRHCRMEMGVLKTRIRRQRERGVLGDGKLPVVPCVICGTRFEQKQGNYVLCGCPACKKARDKEKQRAWMGALVQAERRNQ